MSKIDQRALRRTCLAMLGSAGILAGKRGHLLGGGFLYLELFDFQIQRRSWNSEFGSRATWPSNFSVAFRERCFYEFLFVVLKVLFERR